MFAWFRNCSPTRAESGVTVVRLGVALIILMHPLHGFFHSENMPQFGAYLSALGYPHGEWLAWGVILTQSACSLALLLNRMVILACLGHMAIIFAGIVHVHYPNGWYVVGPGEGGMEWGVILLVCLTGVLFAHWPRRSGARPVMNKLHTL
ncbi:MAG: DoxX family protein [Burkholderiales bacterium]|nr:DoxX family protein [Burkholderiales bacterium]